MIKNQVPLHSPLQHRNQLLSALPAADYKLLQPYLEFVLLDCGHIIYESGLHQKHVYFPTSSTASLHYVTKDGSSSEIAVVGNEGLIGISSFMGGDTTPSCAVVQEAGYSYRLNGRVLKSAFECGGALQHLMLRYTQALITQMTQTAACNRHHSLEQQLCRRLLSSLDRRSSNEIILTQEMIANMLGVRREGVTEAAGRLQAAGLISYRRGHITILDREGLEARACECYGVVKKEYERLLPGSTTGEVLTIF